MTNDISTEQPGVVKNHLKYWTKLPPSAIGIRVAELLDLWHGLHHFEDSLMKRVDWSNDLYIEMKLNHRSSVGQLSTHDFSGLTRLVFLAHDSCIRVDICPCNGAYFKLMFHPRAGRSGDTWRRHPTLEQSVESWRKTHSAILFTD